mmetsp:Transcript_137183/g.273740  ORF Transcript_137183/g.273740 Transcript_137183/m.273740 type:complete len:243 (-) Transcript_137183:1187-1915(-)
MDVRGESWHRVIDGRGDSCLWHAVRCTAPKACSRCFACARAVSAPAATKDGRAVSAVSACCCWDASTATTAPDQRKGDVLLVMECLAASWTAARREGEQRLCSCCMRCSWPPHLACIGETKGFLPFGEDGLIRLFGERPRYCALGVAAAGVLLGRPLALASARWAEAEQELVIPSKLLSVAPEFVLLLIGSFKSPSCVCCATSSASLSWRNPTFGQPVGISLSAVDEPVLQASPRDPGKLLA